MMINVLGTEYRIRKKAYADEPAFEKRGIDGYCDSCAHEIVYCDLDTDTRLDTEPKETKRICEKQTIRHELIHAFLSESGLRESSYGVDYGWACDEEIVDWFAVQSPKIFKLFQELELL